MPEEVSISREASGGVFTVCVIDFTELEHSAAGGRRHNPRRGASGALPLFSNSPKRAQPKPGESHGKEHRDGGTARAYLPCVIFAVLLHGGTAKTEGHDQENHARDFKPELMQNTGKRTQRRESRALDRVERTAARCLLARNFGHHTGFPPRRNFAHSLDFSSLQRYNGALCCRSEPFGSLEHPNERSRYADLGA